MVGSTPSCIQRWRRGGLRGPPKAVIRRKGESQGGWFDRDQARETGQTSQHRQVASRGQEVVVIRNLGNVWLTLTKGCLVLGIVAHGASASAGAASGWDGATYVLTVRDMEILHDVNTDDSWSPAPDLIVRIARTDPEVSREIRRLGKVNGRQLSRHRKVERARDDLLDQREKSAEKRCGTVDRHTDGTVESVACGGGVHVLEVTERLAAAARRKGISTPATHARNARNSSCFNGGRATANVSRSRP